MSVYFGISTVENGERPSRKRIGGGYKEKMASRVGESKWRRTIGWQYFVGYRWSCSYVKHSDDSV